MTGKGLIQFKNTKCILHNIVIYNFTGEDYETKYSSNDIQNIQCNISSTINNIIVQLSSSTTCKLIVHQVW